MAVQVFPFSPNLFGAMKLWPDFTYVVYHNTQKRVGKLSIDRYELYFKAIARA